MGRTVIIVALGVLVMVGVGYTVYDYRSWRWEETKNFGHGPGDSAPKTTLPELSQVYRNDVIQLRLRVPEGWMVKEEPKFTMSDPDTVPELAKLLVFEKREEVVAFGDRITISILKTRVNLPDLVSSDAGTIKDRETVNNGRISITVVRFPNKIVAYTTRNEFTYVITWTGVDDGTFLQVLQTVAIT